jgi:hypothetical protein
MYISDTYSKIMIVFRQQAVKKSQNLTFKVNFLGQKFNFSFKNINLGDHFLFKKMFKLQFLKHFLF